MLHYLKTWRGLNTMKDKEIFRIVKKHIDQMDYYALLAGGAPKNEFDGESKKITMQISPEMSSFEIANIITKIFNDSFSEHDDATVFLSVAEQIKKDLT